MLIPDLDLGRRFVAAHPTGGEVLLCAVTGSHLYGFPSPDSDLDLKGIHLAPTESFLGLTKPKDTFDALEPCDGTECDYTSQEAGFALGLLLRGNGNMLERLLSPLQLYPGPATEELGQLARNAVSRCFADHYKGFFRGMCREHGNAPIPEIKTMLYAYRVALTGIHLLRTGELVADLSALAPEYGMADVAELIARKRGGDELEALPDALNQWHCSRWPDLEQGLAEALDASPLPQTPSNRGECEIWLLAARRGAL